MHKADYYTGIFLIIFSLLVMVESYRMPVLDIHGGLPAAPGIAPFFVGFLLFCMAIGLVVSARKKGGITSAITKKKAMEFLKNEEFRRIFMVFGITALYVFVLIGFAHYFIATFVYLASFMILFGYRRWVKMAVVIVVAITGVYLLFNKIFLIPLP